MLFLKEILSILFDAVCFVVGGSVMLIAGMITSTFMILFVIPYEIIRGGWEFLCWNFETPEQEADRKEKEKMVWAGSSWRPKYVDGVEMDYSSDYGDPEELEHIHWQSMIEND